MFGDFWFGDGFFAEGDPEFENVVTQQGGHDGSRHDYGIPEHFREDEELEDILALQMLGLLV